MGERLPQNVSQFLEAHIDSVEQLDALLLLREEPNQTWTATDVTQRLKTSRCSVEIRLDTLVDHGLIERAGETFAYTLSGTSERHVRDLARCYRSRRAAVIHTIFSGQTSSR